MKLNLNEAELRARLEYFSRRATSLTGTTLVKNEQGQLCGVPLGAQVSKFFKDLLTGMGDPAQIAKRNEFLEKASKDPKARAALCAIRIEQFNNYLYASQNILDFYYEQVNLKPDERPVFENTTMNEVSVNYTGADGSPKMVRVDRDDQFSLKNLHYVDTDWVRYKKVDIYRGSVVDAALATLRLAYDWNNKAEALAFTLLLTGFGNFVFAGKRQNYPYVANSRINAANLPTTNDLVIPNVGAATYFDWIVFDMVIKYCAQWAGADPEGDIRPTGRILIPGADTDGLGKRINPTNAKPSVPAEKILEAGWFGVHYLGIDWVLIPDNTLAPGCCYPELSRKPGRAWYKPSLDQEKINDSDELDEKNEEERKMRKVFGCDINSASRRFMCRVTYRA